ncbi:tape measure protein [Campylobacter sp. RM16188]|uniref:tape measure protein n=1 Tax=Campylobacter sp. RM16188 TaxID=1705725 RepID=UPI001553481A|nr:tape measure protein [Campylobacter sp. RM16188]
MATSNDIRIKITIDGDAKSVTLVRNEVNKLGNSLNNVDTYANALKSTLGKMAAIGFAVTGINNAISKSIASIDTLANATGRLKLVTSSMNELKDVTEKLFKISNDSRVSFAGSVDIYSRFARSLKATGIEQQKMLDVTQAVNKSLIISGASAQSANAALVQLAQGLAANELRGQELLSVMEQTPRLAEAIAKGMGISIGELRKVAEQGSLSAKAVFDALLSQKDVIEKEFTQMPKTIEQSMTILANNMQNMLGKFNEATGFTAGIANATTSLANSFEKIYPYIGTISSGIMSLAYAFGAYKISVIAAEIKTSLFQKTMMGGYANRYIASLMSAKSATDIFKISVIATTGAMNFLNTAMKRFLPALVIGSLIELALHFDTVKKKLEDLSSEWNKFLKSPIEVNKVALKEKQKLFEKAQQDLKKEEEKLADMKRLWGNNPDLAEAIERQERAVRKLQGLYNELRVSIDEENRLIDASNRQRALNTKKSVQDEINDLEKLSKEAKKAIDIYGEGIFDEGDRKIREIEKTIEFLSLSLSKTTNDGMVKLITNAIIGKEQEIVKIKEQYSKQISDEQKRAAEEAKKYIKEKFDAQISYSKAVKDKELEHKLELAKLEHDLNDQVAQGLISLSEKREILHQKELDRIAERKSEEKRLAAEFDKEYEDRAVAREKLFELTDNMDELYKVVKDRHIKELQELVQISGAVNIDINALAEKETKKHLQRFTKNTKHSFQDIKGSWADTVSTMQKTVEEGFFDFFMQKTKSLKGALKDIGQGVFRDFISPYARSLSQGLAGGFGALLGGGSNLASIASFYGLTKNSEGGFSGQVNGTDVVISGTGEILSGNSAFGGAGNILNAVSNLKSIYSMMSNGYTGMVGGLTSPFAKGGLYLTNLGYGGLGGFTSGFGSGISTVLGNGATYQGMMGAYAGGLQGGGLGAGYTAGAAAGGALTGGAIGYGIGTLGDKMFGAQTYAPYTGAAAGAALGGYAAVAGSLSAIPVYGWIAAAIVLAIGGMIGKWKTTDVGIGIGEGIGGKIGDKISLEKLYRYEDKEKKTWFSKKNKTIESGLDDETIKAINGAVSNIHHLLKGISATDHLYLREGKFSGNDFFNQNLAGAAISAFTGQLGKDSTHKSFAALADKEKKEIYEVILSTLGTVKQAVTEIDFIGIKNPIISAAKVVENSIDTFKISTDNAFGEFSNILSISTDKFKEKYLNALRNDFTKENVDKWNAAKQAYEAARKAQEDYTKAVISFTQQIAGIQGGFYGANKIDTTFLGLQSIYRRFNTLLGGLNYDISDNQRKDVAKFGSATDIHSWSKYLLSLSSDQMQVFLSEGNTELRQELVKVLTEHKQAIDANGGKEGYIKSLADLEALNKQIAALKLAEQAEKTLQLQREQLNILHLQRGAIEKLGNIATRVRDSVIDNSTSGINYKNALSAAKEAYKNKDYNSKAFENLGNAATHQQRYFENTSKTYEEYKLNMLKMAAEIEGIADRTTLDDINKSIKKTEEQIGVVGKHSESQLAALEMQRQQLIQNSQSQISALDALLGSNSPMIRYLRDVLDKLINKDMPKDAPKTQIPNYSSGVDTTNNKFRTANGALLLTKLDEQINQTYLSTLRRSVDPSGLEFWRNKINSGQLPLSQLAAELIKSATAITQSSNPEDWIEWYKAKGFKPFADGGIVTRPTRALIGEAGYDEAVIPLKDGRGVKVYMDGEFKNLTNSNARLESIITEMAKGIKELVMHIRNIMSHDGTSINTKVKS